MKGVKHYTRDGKEFKGNTHKMPNGQVHTNKSHTKTSVRETQEDYIRKRQEGRPGFSCTLISAHCIPYFGLTLCVHF